MRTVALSFAIAVACSAAAVRAQQAVVPTEVGVYAETADGTVALKKTFGGFDVAGSMPTGGRTRALAFPIPAVDDVPMPANVTGFIVNLPTVQDTAAANAQMHFAVGDHVREPDYQTMTVQVGKFRTGVYRITSPQMTNDWLTTAYAKLTSSRKYRGTQPPAIVGLILLDQMYPVRIDPVSLTTRR